MNVIEDDIISSILKHQVELLKKIGIEGIIDKGQMTHDQVITMLKNVNQVICNIEHMISVFEEIDRFRDGKGCKKS